MVSPYNTDAEPGALRASRRLLILRNRFTALLVPTSSIQPTFSTRVSFLSFVAGLVHSPTQKQRIHPNIPPHSKIHPSLSVHTKNKNIYKIKSTIL